MFERMMAVNREAFEAEYLDAAYHALAAALHVAAEEQNGDHLTEVAEVAARQAGWVDLHAPDHHHSSTSACQRGQVSVFALLSHQANGRQAAIKRDLGLLGYLGYTDRKWRDGSGAG